GADWRRPMPAAILRRPAGLRHALPTFEPAACFWHHATDHSSRDLLPAAARAGARPYLGGAAWSAEPAADRPRLVGKPHAPKRQQPFHSLADARAPPRYRRDLRQPAKGSAPRPQ